MFEKILFATSAEPTCDAAAETAFGMAKIFNSKLEVFHVFGVPTRGFGQFVHDSRTGETQVSGPEAEQKAKDELRQAYAELAGDRSVAFEVCTGTPHMEILRRAHKVKPDLIIMGAHYGDGDSSALSGVFAGSTVQMVAKSARSPVMIVARPCETCWGYFSNVVFGTDFSQASGHAFDFALKLAKHIDTKLHIFHAVDVGSQAALTGQTHVEDLIKDAENKIKDTYLPRMGDYDLYDVTVWEGTPFIEITKFARQENADLIIMAHHTRKVEEDQAKLGTTMEQVVMRSVCPVMSVNRPEAK